MKITINGQKHEIEVNSGKSLLEVLHDDLELTGVKYGCGEGQCGACTVLLEGRPIRSCITPASGAANRKIITIEGLERDGHLHPLQETFLKEEAFQCGYCTPGMILSGVALLNKKPEPSRNEIVNAMQGHICRCGTYSRIITAITKAAQAIKEQGE